MTVLLASSAALARTVKNPAVTVEAEYGAFVAEGTRYTAAHHQKTGPNGGDQPAPCIDRKIPTCNEHEIILISHIDLDTVGGVMRAQGRMALFSGFDHRLDLFWNAAAFVDTNGPHKLRESHPMFGPMAAWWAWLTENRPRFDAAHKVVDVTGFMDRCYHTLSSLLLMPPDSKTRMELIEKGEAFVKAGKALNKSSFIGAQVTQNEKIVIARKSDQFVNHLYVLPGLGIEADCVCALNTETKKITLSFRDNGETINACDMVRRVWADKDEDGNYLAGGHPGIAGTPRGKRQGLAGLWGLVHTVVFTYES